MKLQKFVHREKYSVFIGIMARFQGLGFMISTDQPMTTSNFIYIEIKLLWFKFWAYRRFN